LVEMTGKGLGMTAIVDQQDKLLGIYTDGDLRRTLAHEIDLNTQIREIMSVDPVTVRPDILAAELVAMMKTSKINGVLVTVDQKLVGALNMQDLLRAGVL